MADNKKEEKVSQSSKKKESAEKRFISSKPISVNHFAAGTEDRIGHRG